MLSRYRADAATIFDLLVRNEVDLTAALGWTLAHSPVMLEAMSQHLDLNVQADGSAPAIGMGAVYHRTADGRALRAPAPDRDEALLEAFFRSYASALADVVLQRLLATGRVVIIDLHSFPLVGLVGNLVDSHGPVLAR